MKLKHCLLKRVSKVEYLIEIKIFVVFLAPHNPTIFHGLLCFICISTLDGHTITHLEVRLGFGFFPFFLIITLLCSVNFQTIIHQFIYASANM